MKKIITSILFFSLISMGFSQGIQVLDLNNNIITGTVVQVYILPNSNRGDDFLAYNSSSANNCYNCRRTILSMDANDSTQFCWGGFCYGFPINVSSHHDCIAPGDTINFLHNGFHATFVSGPANVGRKVHYQIYNIASGSAADTAGFTIQYNYSTGISEQNTTSTISNAFPNPASSTISLNYSINSSSNKSKIVFYDVLGKDVKEVVLNDKQGTAKLNTNDLFPGIYFYSLLSDDKIISTRKLVITK